MDILVSKSTLKVHEARSLRRLLLTVISGKIAMFGAGFAVPLCAPSFISTLTTIRAPGDRGEPVVPAVLQFCKAISGICLGRRYALLKTSYMGSTLEVV